MTSRGWIRPADQASLEDRPLEFVGSVCPNPNPLGVAAAAAAAEEAEPSSLSQCNVSHWEKCFANS